MIRVRVARPASLDSAVPTEAGHIPATMNIAQAASYLGISKATLYTWRTRRPGFGPRAVKAGGALRYRQADLDLWIEEHAETLNVGATLRGGAPGDSGIAEPVPAPAPALAPAPPSMSNRSRPRYTCTRRIAER